VASVYAEHAREIAREYEGVLVMECFDFPKAFSLDIIDELAILLYPFSPVYLARPDLGVTDFTIYANCNFQGVCADLQNKPWPAAKAGEFLMAFSESARARRLSTYVHGVGSTDVSRVVNEASIDFLDGDVI
ncbi:MAG: hypothetical protein OQK07_04610, partial [Rhodospirillales bacterium]|nr:hypothetical protein [Rhodospirillales bacterium]